MEKRVLLLDDEPAICEITGILLKKLGYDAVISSEGNDAIEQYTSALKAGKPFDVVILDLSIPGGIGGREVMKALKEIDPSIRALVSSGDANDPAVSDFSKFGFSGVLLKPYNKVALNAAIQTVLD